MSEIIVSPSPSNKLVVQDEGAEVVLEVQPAASVTLSATGPQGPIADNVTEAAGCTSNTTSAPSS